MARYISKFAAFKKGVRAARTQLIQTPRGVEERQTQQALVAFFRQGGVTLHERDQALVEFNYAERIESTDPHHASYVVQRFSTGAGDGEDVTKRFSYYDTDEQAMLHNWSDDLKAEVEAVLDHDLGSGNYFKVEELRRQPPWPSYDKLTVQGRRTMEHVVQKIVEVITASGIDPDVVVDYERENLNRPEILKALAEIDVSEDQVVLA